MNKLIKTLAITTIGLTSIATISGCNKKNNINNVNETLTILDMDTLKKEINFHDEIKENQLSKFRYLRESSNGKDKLTLQINLISDTSDKDNVKLEGTYIDKNSNNTIVAKRDKEFIYLTKENTIEKVKIAESNSNADAKTFKDCSENLTKPFVINDWLNGLDKEGTLKETIKKIESDNKITYKIELNKQYGLTEYTIVYQNNKLYSFSNYDKNDDESTYEQFTLDDKISITFPKA